MSKSRKKPKTRKPKTSTADSPKPARDTTPGRKRGRPPKITPALVMQATDAIARGIHKGEIKRLLRLQYKSLSSRSCEKVLALARKYLLGTIGVSADELRAGALEVYRSVLRSAKASANDKIKAQDSIVKMLGLASPLKIQHSGPNDGPIQFDPLKLSLEQLDQLEKIIQAGTETPGDADESES